MKLFAIPAHLLTCMLSRGELGRNINIEKQNEPLKSPNYLSLICNDIYRAILFQKGNTCLCAHTDLAEKVLALTDAIFVVHI